MCAETMCKIISSLTFPLLVMIAVPAREAWHRFHTWMRLVFTMYFRICCWLVRVQPPTVSGLHPREVCLASPSSCSCRALSKLTRFRVLEHYRLTTSTSRGGHVLKQSACIPQTFATRFMERTHSVHATRSSSQYSVVFRALCCTDQVDKLQQCV
jgi:hypothetical protein